MIENKILEMISEEMIDLDEEQLERIINRAILLKIDKYKIQNTLNLALNEVGILYEKDEYTMSDLIMSGILYEKILGILNFYQTNQKKSLKSTGTILLGTIEDDMHDIGKTIFKNAALTEGFQVIDIGVNVKAQAFIEKIDEFQPDIVAISTILTYSRKHIIEIANYLEEQPMEKKIKLIIGGGNLSKKEAETLKVDAFTSNAIDGVKICKKLVENIE